MVQIFLSSALFFPSQAQRPWGQDFPSSCRRTEEQLDWTGASLTTQIPVDNSGEESGHTSLSP